MKIAHHCRQYKGTSVCLSLDTSSLSILIFSSDYSGLFQINFKLDNKYSSVSFAPHLQLNRYMPLILIDTNTPSISN